MKDWQRLTGKTVTVYASGLVYRGTVVEMGPQSLLLRATAGFREIPWERITRLEEDRKPLWGAPPPPGTR